MTELTWQRKIGEILRERNVVSAQQLEEALKIQEMILKPIGKILIDMEVTTEDQIAEALAEQKGFTRISLKTYKINKQAVKLFPLPMARLHKALLIDFAEDRVVLAMADPLDVYAIDDVQMITGHKVKPVVCTESEILEVIDEYLSGVVHPSEEDKIQALKERLEDIAEADSDNIPVFTEKIIKLAADQGVTELFFEPQENESRLRFRLNGDLQDMMGLTAEDHASIVAYFMKTTEKDRKKQDAAAPQGTMQAGKTGVDVKIVFLPGVWGDDIQIKIVNPKSALSRLEGLGLTGETIAAIQNAVSNRWGLILGINLSGNAKTENGMRSLFYDLLRSQASPQKRVIAVESQVKEKIRGVVQVERSPAKEPPLPEDTILSAIEESSPEVFMAIDTEDRDIAKQLLGIAMGGTLVLTSIQADDGIAGLHRFVETSGNPALLAEALKCVIAQKTVKMLCPSCREKFQPKAETLSVLSEKAGFEVAQEEGKVFYTAKGCSQCGDSGFLGEVGIFEVLPISETVKTALVKGKSTRQIQDMMENELMAGLKFDSYKKALEGDISFEELVKQIG